MNLDVKDMLYPLEERIGLPDLFVERKAVGAEYGKWISRIPKKLSKSRAILARKKSGKTAFIQRLFNRLWSLNGAVIPFYLEVPDQRVWYPDFALKYFVTFASHYISFLERKVDLVRHSLSLDAIRQYGENNGLQLLEDDVTTLESKFRLGLHDTMWRTAITAPHRYAAVYGNPVLVIIDEFQNLSGYIYRDRECRTAMDETIPGGYHEWSESKIAPMLVTGSAVGWLINVIDTYLEAGRLTKMWWSPYLAPDEGLEAVYRYAEAYEEPITNETALMLNELTGADPFFISCVVRSQYPGRDLSTPEGVAATVDFETSDGKAELALGWMIYFNKTLDRVNQKYAKRILLHLTRHNQRSWTPPQLKEALDLDLDEQEIHERLVILTKADLIEEFPQGFIYRGHEDGTFYLILQNLYRMEMEAMGMEPEGLAYREKMLREKQSLQGALNEMAGRLAELQLANDMLVRKSFPLSVYFDGFPREPTFILKELWQRFFAQSYRGGGEFDLVVEAEDERTLAVEVRKRKTKIGAEEVARFVVKIEALAAARPGRRILPAYLALGGFTEEAQAHCRENGVGFASRLEYVQKEWSF